MAALCGRGGHGAGVVEHGATVRIDKHPHTIVVRRALQIDPAQLLREQSGSEEPLQPANHGQSPAIGRGFLAIALVKSQLEARCRRTTSRLVHSKCASGVGDAENLPAVWAETDVMPFDQRLLLSVHVDLAQFLLTVRAHGNFVCLDEFEFRHTSMKYVTVKPSLFRVLPLAVAQRVLAPIECDSRKHWRRIGTGLIGIDGNALRLDPGRMNVGGKGWQSLLYLLLDLRHDVRVLCAQVHRLVGVVVDVVELRIDQP